MPLKIAIDARRVRDFGIGTYIRNLIQGLAKLDRSNQYVLVTLPSEVQHLKRLPANFETVTYPKPDSDARGQLQFPFFLKSLRASLCHIPVNRVPLTMMGTYVVTIHDMSSLLFGDRSGLRLSYRRFEFRRGLSRAARVIAVSAATQRDVQEQFGVPEERIRKVYSAPDPEFFRHRHSADARASGPEAEKLERARILERYQIHYPFLLWAGHIRMPKNVPRLVEAFAVARQELAGHPEYADLRLILIGDDVSRHPSVRRAVVQTRVENAVRFLGFVPFDTLRLFYETATAFVFPSLYEGFGLPPLEAMASGTPVITSGVSSLPEVVGDAAMLVNPENVFDIARGIKEVLLNRELRESLIAKGKVHAASYSWERTAGEVLQIYREVGGQS
ncbi:MAG: glycosyltransferase family 1 protein [Bryobacterales bacterium]|nr:glycosyltransferase family 1 protein [Bryobacterales bacterium]